MSDSETEAEVILAGLGVGPETLAETSAPRSTATDTSCWTACSTQRASRRCGLAIEELLETARRDLDQEARRHAAPRRHPRRGRDVRPGVVVAARPRRGGARARRGFPRLRGGVSRAAAGLRRAGAPRGRRSASARAIRIASRRRSCRWSTSRSATARRASCPVRTARPCATRPPKPGVPHPRERVVTARAGDAIVFNGHLWHSGTKNESDARRDALQIVYRRRGGRGSGLTVANATLDRLGAAGLLLI